MDAFLRLSSWIAMDGSRMMRTSAQCFQICARLVVFGKWSKNTTRVSKRPCVQSSRRTTMIWEALTVGLRNFARSRLSEASYSDLMHCLVQSQVLGISPEGLLSQFVLADDKPHNLVPGKSWTLVPFPAAKELKRTGEPKGPTSELVYPVLQYTGGLDQWSG